MDRSFRPIEAYRAWKRLSADPDDTGVVFEIIDALSGRSGERAYRRFVDSETGQRVLREERDLLEILQDREALAAMPEGSLGRTYHDFTAREQISADGLVAASETTPGRRDDATPDQRRFFERLRDCHDLEHVVTGYGRDLRGELALLAFDTAQQWHHGIAFIVGMATLTGGPEERALVRAAWERGKRCAWLSAADWEDLLPRPLDEVRRITGVGAPPTYEAMLSDDGEAARQATAA